MKTKVNLIKLWMTVLLVLGAVGCSNGGGGKSMANLIPTNDGGVCPRPDTCPGGCFKVFPSHCCNADGKIKKPEGAECRDSSFAPAAHVNNALGQMANITGAGESSGRSAASMENLGSKLQTGGNSSAAKAADRFVNREPQSAALENNPVPESESTSPIASVAGEGGGRGSSGGSTSGGGGGGGLGGLGVGVKTDPAIAPSDTPVLASEDSAGTYSGGGGGARGGGGSSFGSLFGGGNEGGVSGKAQDGFNLGRKPAGGDSTTGSADPENYFSMLKPSDSLFKIVERRYMDKAKNWALTDAHDASASVKKLVK